LLVAGWLLAGWIGKIKTRKLIFCWQLAVDLSDLKNPEDKNPDLRLLLAGCSYLEKLRSISSRSLFGWAG
jgi:hypothetical protein